MADTNTTKPYVPVWEKYALTIYEAAEYFGIGEHRLRTFGAILKKWTAKSERWYNNKKRRETHGKHQVYRGIQAKHSKLV